MSALVFLDFNTISPLISKEQLDFIKNQNTVICFTPASDYWAEKNHITYHTIDAYIDSLSLRNKGYENFEVVNIICQELSRILLECADFKEMFMRSDPDPMHGFYYTIKIICDALDIRIEILSKILNYYRPEVIYYYGSNIDINCGLWEIVFKNKVSLYYSVLKALADKYTFTLNTVLVKYNKKPISIFDRLLSNMKRIRRGLFQLSTNMPYFFDMRSKGILLLSHPYDWEEPLRLLVKSKRAKVYYMPENNNNIFIYKGVKFYFSKLFPKLFYNSKDKFLRKEFTQDSAQRKFFYSRLLEKRNAIPLDDLSFGIMFTFLIEALLETKMIYTSYFNETKEIIKKNNIQALVSIMIHQPIDFMRVRAAQEIGVPVCIMQHGGVGFDIAPMYYWGDVYPSDYVFLYGKALYEYYKSLSLKKNVRYCIAGSSLIDGLRNEKGTGIYRNIRENKCLYLLHLLKGNSSYINRKNYKSDIYLWRKQKDVLDIFSRYKDWIFIIKPHPDPDALYNPLMDYISEQGISNIIVDKSNKATDIMRCCDLVVLDYLATGLIESMALNKDTIVFSGYFTVKSDLERILKDMIYISSDKDEFLYFIDSFLKNGSVQKQKGGFDTFLSDYATHLNDNRSADRIKEYLMGLINSGEH